MEDRVQSKDFAGRKARGLRSAEGQLGRKRVRPELVDCGRCDGRITRLDLGKKIEHQRSLVPRWKMDRVSFRPSRTNQGHAGRQETTLRYFHGRWRGAATHQSRKRCECFRLGAGFATPRFFDDRPGSQNAQDRKEKYGEYSVVHADYQMTHLWTIEVPNAGSMAAEPKRLTDGDKFSVG